MTAQQRRGPITDTRGADGRWTASCPHGKTWPEGDRFERAGGSACEPCVLEWARSRS